MNREFGVGRVVRGDGRTRRGSSRGWGRRHFVALTALSIAVFGFHAAGVGAGGTAGSYVPAYPQAALGPSAFAPDLTGLRAATQQMLTGPYGAAAALPVSAYSPAVGAYTPAYSPSVGSYSSTGVPYTPAEGPYTPAEGPYVPFGPYEQSVPHPLTCGYGSWGSGAWPNSMYGGWPYAGGGGTCGGWSYAGAGPNTGIWGGGGGGYAYTPNRPYTPVADQQWSGPCWGSGPTYSAPGCGASAMSGPPWGYSCSRRCP
jgi:hypothetical protein